MLNSREHLTIARILKVNHAGEYGAIRIYRAQLFVSRYLYPDVAAFLELTLGHEINHCAKFRAAMPERQTRPCRIMALWGNGGYVLGLLTALLGRRGIWVCTAAVEATVHRHLNDQLHFLAGKDDELHALIMSIQDEELMHLHHAEGQIRTGGFWSGILNRVITVATDAVIWLSTWGDSSRMARDLAASTR